MLVNVIDVLGIVLMKRIAEFTVLHIHGHSSCSNLDPPFILCLNLRLSGISVDKRFS